jgi:hypothetical protein
VSSQPNPPPAWTTWSAMLLRISKLRQASRTPYRCISQATASDTLLVGLHDQPFCRRSFSGLLMASQLLSFVSMGAGRAQTASTRRAGFTACHPYAFCSPNILRLAGVCLTRVVGRDPTRRFVPPGILQLPRLVKVPTGNLCSTCCTASCCCCTVARRQTTL